MEFERERRIGHIEEEDFTEERLGSLYAALGNNEAKALTFLLMKPGVVYDGQDISTEVRRAQTNTQKGWSMGNEGPYHYLQKSFEPVGLVAQEVTDKNDNKYGYVKTAWGNAIGVSFAGLMLKLSHDHPDFSLYDIFGSTVSTSKSADSALELKKRSPLTRIQLYRALISSGDNFLSVSDIAGKMDEDDQTLVHRHLKDLAKSGIIEFVSDKGVTIPVQNRKLLFDIVVNFQKILEIDPATLEEGRIFAGSVINDPEKVTQFMRKAKEHSRNANQSPIDQTSDEVFSIIQQMPGLTTEQVRDRLEEEFGRSLSTHRVRRIIKHAMEKRNIAIPKGSQNVKWKIDM